MSTNDKTGSIGDDAEFLRLMCAHVYHPLSSATLKAVVAYIDARPTQPTTSSVPDGWKLVPIKPTAEMIDAACAVDPEQGSPWAAYLAAAPAPDLTERAATPDLTNWPPKHIPERAADLGVRDAALAEAEALFSGPRDFPITAREAREAIRALRSQPVSAPKGEQQ